MIFSWCYNIMILHWGVVKIKIGCHGNKNTCFLGYKYMHKQLLLGEICNMKASVYTCIDISVQDINIHSLW